ncbi:MAG TPA: DNA primase [Streptosporangiaceae bacterium]|nr:DNA primase [Streptosporangiaceae bacterium]
MAGRIRDEDIALVRERSAVDEVVGEYLQLRNAGGGSLKGLCPFHDEKTPSFNVTPSRGLWYCFSCTEGGDVIRFVQRIDNLSFAEAVERLAARAGIELRYEQGGTVPGQEHSQRRRLIEAHRAAQEFFSERIGAPDAGAAREFLASRGFQRADAEKFGVGYAPAEWEALTRHLRGRGFTDAELLLGGLASQGRRGPMDRFRGRLIWPIRDLTGDVIAFGARKLNQSEDGPKYLNTPETPLFKKSSVLYGADLAKRDIQQRRQAVIVEGYTDVMACHLSGITTAVATSGTSFGEGHIKILRRLLVDADWDRGEVIFTFDGDAAGRRAAIRAFDMEERFVSQTFVAVQSEGLDPCDLRLKHGDGAVKDLIARRVPLYEFAIRNAIDEYQIDGNSVDTAHGKLAALDAAASLIARIKDDGRRKVYAGLVDRWLGLMDQELILARIAEQVRKGPHSRNQRSAPASARPAPRDDRALPGAEQATRSVGRAESAQQGGAPQWAPDPAYDPNDPVVGVEREALKLAVQRPALCGPAFDALGAECFTAPVHAAVFGLIAECGGTTQAGSGREWAERLRTGAPDDRARGFVTRLAVEALRVPRSDGEADARYAEAVMARVEELSVSREIARIKSRLQRMNPVDEQSAYNRMFGDLVALEQRKKTLTDQSSGAV